MHLKRNKVPKKWPVKRKGSKYVVRPNHNLRKGIPVLIILRDILELVENKKEVKTLINLGKIKVNNKEIKSEKHPLILFDILSLKDRDFRLVLSGKKYKIEEGRGEKISKVIGKKILKGRRLQVNLSDGRNYFTKKKIKTGDSVVIDIKENKISKILPLKESCKVLFISGRHMGEEGEVTKIEGKILVKVNGESIESKIESLIVIE